MNRESSRRCAFVCRSRRDRRSMACCAVRLARPASRGSTDTTIPRRRPRTTRSGFSKRDRRHARKILVLAPGTSASAASFAPLAKLIADRTHDWQVWTVERRENLLEDHSRWTA